MKSFVWNNLKRVLKIDLVTNSNLCLLPLIFFVRNNEISNVISMCLVFYLIF